MDRDSRGHGSFQSHAAFLIPSCDDERAGDGKTQLLKARAPEQLAWISLFTDSYNAGREG